MKKRYGLVRKILGTYIVRPRECGVKIPAMLTLYLPENRVIRLHTETLLQTKNNKLTGLSLLSIGDLITALRYIPQTETDPDLNGALLKESEHASVKQEVIEEEEDLSDAVRPQPREPEAVQEHEPDVVMISHDEVTRLYGGSGLLTLAQKARLKRRTQRRS